LVITLRAQLAVHIVRPAFQSQSVAAWQAADVVKLVQGSTQAPKFHRHQLVKQLSWVPNWLHLPTQMVRVASHLQRGSLPQVEESV
jgi:hypothetical protein